MSISQNFPTIRPTLNLNFARSKRLDPRITFTRSSTATYVGADGLIKTASADEARFDHDPVTGESLGLLIEESRTNYTSIGIDSWNDGYNSSFKINQAAIAPDGTLTAVKIGRGTTANYQIIYTSFANIPTNTPLIFSFYLKAAEYDSVFFQTNDGNWINQFFDISSGITNLGSSIDAAGMYPVANGWHRCWVKFDSASSTLQLTLHPTTSSPVAGDGTSGEFIWGTQLEAGSFPTSYIPTSASSVTRQPDNAQITGTNFTDFYNSASSTIYMEARLNSPGTLGQCPMMSFEVESNNNRNNSFAISRRSGQGVRALNYNSIGIEDMDITSSPWGDGSFKKFAYALDNSGSSAALTDNGTLVGTNSSYATSSLSSVDILRIGAHNSGGFSPFNGIIKKLIYYPERLTNSQLQNLTK